MSTQQSNTVTGPGHSGQSSHDEASLAVGGPTSGEEGATPTDETQQETGGSGGAGLTRHEGDTPGEAPQAKETGARCKDVEPEGADTALTHVTRGYQDTRGHQAGGSDTGLGAPETGGNQTPADLDRQRK
jgi:hypothetical protein